MLYKHIDISISIQCCSFEN